MPQLLYYKQTMADGGIRYGVSVNFTPLLHWQREGKGNKNATMNWHVDVNCAGTSIPTEPEEVRSWLLAHSNFLKNGLAQAAQILKKGIKDWPLIHDISPPSPAVYAFIMVSPLEKMKAKDLAKVLEEMKNELERILEQMPVAQEEAVDAAP